MINGYFEVNEIAEKWNVTTRRVQIMCAEGLIPGAVKFGRSWAIPEDAERPTDGRVTTGEYKNWRKTTQNNSE
ncbi:DNA-binding protein [Lacrimispora sp.]|uniref:DNA-binding protein n=1 Tax=Lacrimispora sp. TaxID=2719234 RepID=UPI0039934F96